MCVPWKRLKNFYVDFVLLGHRRENALALFGDFSLPPVINNSLGLGRISKFQDGYRRPPERAMWGNTLAYSDEDGSNVGRKSQLALDLVLIKTAARRLVWCQTALLINANRPEGIPPRR